MNFPTLFVAGTVPLGFAWACFGQDDRATDRVAPNPQVQNPMPESPDSLPDVIVLEPPSADFGVGGPLPYARDQLPTLDEGLRQPQERVLGRLDLHVLLLTQGI
jgi:hypothetical protein